MGVAFRPSRSGFYGAQKWQAAQGLAGQMMGQFRQLDAQQYADEYRRQTSNARVAMMRERYGLDTLMAEHARDPASWLPTLQKNKGKIRDKVLEGLTLPAARQAAEADLNEAMIGWEHDLFNKGRVQSARNAAVDYEAGLQSIVGESREYPEIDDAMADFEAAAELIEANEATPEAADFKTRWAAREIFGDYLIQEALRTGDANFVEKANEVIPKDILDGKKPLFGPEELGALKKRYDGAANAAKAEAEKARKERGTAFEKQMTIGLIRGQLTIKDERGNDINALEAILNNPDLNPETMRTLTNLYNKKAGGAGPEQVSRVERQTSYGALSRVTARLENGEMSFKSWFKVFEAHALNVDEEDAERFRERAEKADPFKSWRDDAMKLGDDALSSLAGDWGEDWVLKRDEVMGGLMEELDRLSRDQEKMQKPLSRKEYDDAARQIIRRLFAQEYEKIHGPTEPEQPEEKPRRRSRYSIGQVVTGRDGSQYEVVKFDADGNPLFRKK